MRFRHSAITLTIIDIIAGLAALIAVFLLFSGRYFPAGTGNLFLFAAIVITCDLTGFIFAGLYRRLWRYAQLNDFFFIFWGVLLGQTLGYLITRVAFNTSLPLRIWVTQSLILFLLTVASRGLIRVFYEGVPFSLHNGHQHGKKVIVVGAGSAGAMVIREIQRAMRDQYNVVGLVDDDHSKQRCSVHSVPVLGTLDDLPKLADMHQIEEIIIAIPSAEQEIIRRVSHLDFVRPVKLKVIPGINAIINGTADIKRFRDVQVEDLLGREPVRVDLAEVAAYLTGKRILITGAGGSIGSELCRQVARFNPESLIMLGRGENSIYEVGIEMEESFPKLRMYKVIADIRDRQNIRKIFDQYRPHVVFHAAAHKHVPLMEDWPEEAFKNNIIGTRNVALAAHENNCERFVLISTDKAIKPSSVMGATKRVAEMVVRTLSDISTTKFVAVRFGNVLGSRGSVVPLFKRQIMRGGPITITHPDMQRYFMTIPEAVQLVIQAAAMGNGGEVFVLDMGEPVYIQELAENLIRLSGLIPGKDIEIVYSGVRPGEKLFEELFSVEEGDVATRHERIFAAAMPNGIRKDLLLQIGKYEEQLRNGQQLNIPSILQNLITDAELSSAEAQVAATSEVGVRLSGGQISG